VAEGAPGPDPHETLSPAGPRAGGGADAPPDGGGPGPDPHETLPPPGPRASEGAGDGGPSPEGGAGDEARAMAEDALSSRVFSALDRPTPARDDADAPPELHGQTTIARLLEGEKRELREALQTLQGCLSDFDVPPPEVVNRLDAARKLAHKGSIAAALQLVEEAIVLSRTISSVEGRHPRATRAGLEPVADIESTAQGVAETTFQTALGGDAFQEAVRSLVEKRLEAHLEGQAFRRSVAALLGRALDAHLRAEPFARAAAEAAAARPAGLLDRPETLARIEAVACERESVMLGSARFVERIADLVRERSAEIVADAGVDDRVEAAIEERLQGLLDSPRLAELIDGRTETWTEALTQDVDRRARRLLDEDAFADRVDERVRGLLRSPTFGARLEAALRSPSTGRTLDEHLQGSDALRELIDARARGVLTGEELDAKVDAVARQRCESLVTAAGFKRAVDDRIRQALDGAMASLQGDVEERAARRAGERLLESDALKARLKEGAEAAVDGFARKALEERLAERLPALIDDLLQDGQPLQERIAELVDRGFREGVDEEKVIKVVHKELANREALSAAKLTGDGFVDPATAVARSEALSKVIEEKIQAFKQAELAAQREKKSRKSKKPASRKTKKTTKKKSGGE